MIDKDRAAAVLARDVRAQELHILTAVDKVAIHFGRKNQKDLDRLILSEAKQYLEEGEFPPGSMGPKIEAAIQFLEEGGEEVLITSIERFTQARLGMTGTRVVHR